MLNTYIRYHPLLLVFQNVAWPEFVNIGDIQDTLTYMHDVTAYWLIQLFYVVVSLESHYWGFLDTKQDNDR